MKLFIKLITLIFLSLTFTQTQASKIPIEEVLKRATKSKDVEDQIKVARMYHLGERTTKSLGKAVIWYRKAARQGNVLAQTKMNEILLWIEKAAEQGNPEALRAQGIIYLNFTKNLRAGLLEPAAARKRERKMTPLEKLFKQAEAARAEAARKREGEIRHSRSSRCGLAFNN